MGAKSGMESGSREPAVAGDGAVVCVDGALGSRGVQFGQSVERGGGSRAARSALFRLDVDVFHLCFERGRGGVCSPLFPIGLGMAAKSVVQQAHKGRRDPPASIQSWLRAAGLAADFWIPAFAGMTGKGEREWQGRNH